MATVTEIVTGALKLLEVNPSESAITPDEIADGLISLNDMMNEWNVDGIDVGYETLDDAADELFVNLGSIGAIKANLAIYIAAEYGKTVSAALAARAKRAKKAMRATVKLNSLQLPDTLPIGSGNENNHFVADGDSPGNLRNSRFYPSNTSRRCN